MCVLAALLSLLVVVSEIRGQSDMTSFTAGERRAVSIAHKVSVCVGGSMKIQERKKRKGREKGVGQLRFPIHTMKKGNVLSFVCFHELRGTEQ